MLTVRLDSESFEDDHTDDVSHPFDEGTDDKSVESYSNNDRIFYDEDANTAIELNCIVMEKWLTVSHENDRALARLGLSIGDGDEGDAKMATVPTAKENPKEGVSKIVFAQDIAENDKVSLSEKEKYGEEENIIDLEEPQKRQPMECGETRETMWAPKTVNTVQSADLYHVANASTENRNSDSKSAKDNKWQAKSERNRLHYLRDEAQIDFYLAIKSALGDANAIRKGRKRREKEKDPKKTEWLMREARKDFLRALSNLSIGHRHANKKDNLRDEAAKKEKYFIQQFLDGVKQDLKFTCQCADRIGKQHDDNIKYWTDETDTADSSDIPEILEEERRKMRRRARRHDKKKKESERRRNARDSQMM